MPPPTSTIVARCSPWAMWNCSPEGAGTISALRRRTHEAIVAHRAGGVGGGGLEPLREDPLGHLAGHLGDPRRPLPGEIVHAHLLVVEHVVVGLPRGLQPPRLSRPHR